VGQLHQSKEKGMFDRIVSRKLFVMAALGVVAAMGAYSAIPVSAQPDPNAPPRIPGGPGERQGGQNRPPSLEGAMKQMERSYKALARQLDDPSKDELSLRAISMLQAGVATGKGMVPHIVEEKPEAERPAFLAEYRKTMLDVLKAAIDLEEKLVAGDREGAKAALETLHKMEEDGHRKFTPEDHNH
jgi:hypothetical protein